MYKRVYANSAWPLPNLRAAMRKAEAPLGALPRWVKIVIAIQFVLLLLGPYLLAMAIAHTSMQLSAALTFLMESAARAHDAQAAEALRTVAQLGLDGRVYWRALISLLFVAFLLSAALFAVTPWRASGASPKDGGL